MSGPRYDKVNRKPNTPRRVRNGVKLRRRDDAELTSWVAVRWVSTLRPLFEHATHDEGLEYARAGQTVSLDFESGRVDTMVQGRAAQPYRTVIRMDTFSPAQWNDAIEAMSREAMFAANLLAGELPSTIERAFEQLDLQLMPAVGRDLVVECSCGAASPCKHAAAVTELAASFLEEDPFLLFTLRGLPGTAVVERLREARTLNTRGVSSALPTPAIADEHLEAPSFDPLTDSFWRPGPDLAELETMPPPEHASHALLRRLGPSKMDGRFPLVGLLASIYDTISDSARHLRDQAERLED